MSKITSENRAMFEDIKLSGIYLLIGKAKVKIDRTGLYNQIWGHLKRTRRDTVFIDWLCEVYGVELLTAPIVKQYEDKLRADSKNSIYTECLRVKYCDDSNIEFYGVLNGNQLSYLTSVNDKSFYNTLIRYLKFNKNCKRISRELGYNVISMSVAALKKEIDECLEFDLLPELDDIKVLSNDPNEYCLAYFDLNRLVENNNVTNAWDSFMYGIKDPQAKEVFMAALYSLFVGNNRSRQIIYLVGPGNSGKSRVANVIDEVFMEINSGICTALETLLFQDRFSAASYTYKHFVLAADCKDLGILRSTLVKNITGDDSVAAVEKGKDKEKKHLFSKIFVTSNKLPWCDTSKPEELSRILLFQLDTQLAKESRDNWDTARDGVWRELLKKQVFDFLGKCKKYYHKWLSQDGDNIVPYESMKEILESGAFFIKRDIVTWWDNCIQPYQGENQTNSIRLSILYKDFNRFAGDLNQSGKYDRVIKSFLSTFLIERGITIHQLDVGNELVINGYEFIDSDPKDRITAASIIESELDKVNTGEKILKELDA